MRIIRKSSYLTNKGLIFLAVSLPLLFIGFLIALVAPPISCFLGLVPLAVGGWAFRSGLHYIRGYWGEKSVGGYLSDRLDDRYVLIQNIQLPNSQADFDAVLLGAAAIYVLEIKNYSPRNHYRCEGDDWYYRRPPKRYRRLEKSPTKQAQYNASYLKSYLSKQGVKRIPVEPAIVIANDEVKVYQEKSYVPIYRKAELVSKVKADEHEPAIDANVLNEALRILETINR